MSQPPVIWDTVVSLDAPELHQDGAAGDIHGTKAKVHFFIDSVVFVQCYNPANKNPNQTIKIRLVIKTNVKPIQYLIKLAP